MNQPLPEKSMTLSELAETIGARLFGDAAKTVTGINTIQDAEPGQVCFLASGKHAGKLEHTRAAAVIVGKAVDACPVDQLVVENVDRSLIAALKLFAPALTGQQGIHPTAVVDPTAVIDPTAAVGPYVTVAAGVKIGPRSVIGPGCSIGENSTIGADSRLNSHVVVYHNCHIGNQCVIQANSTIGSTGFGYAFIDGAHRLIPHNGGVIIEDTVEIGANSCVDRAKFGNTVIGAGTKIDNLVQIAHNVQVGKLCLMASQVGIAGSTRIGNGVVFAGHSGASDNKTIGDGAVICAKTAAMKDVAAGQTVMGMPPQELQRELRCVSVYQRLPELAKELKNLAKKVEEIAAKNDKNRG